MKPRISFGMHMSPPVHGAAMVWLPDKTDGWTLAILPFFPWHQDDSPFRESVFRHPKVWDRKDVFVCPNGIPNF